MENFELLNPNVSIANFLLSFQPQTNFLLDFIGVGDITPSVEPEAESVLLVELNQLGGKLLSAL